MKPTIFALLILVLALLTLPAPAQSNAIPVLASVSTNGVTVLVHDAIRMLHTNPPVIISQWQIVSQTVYETRHLVTTDSGQRRTNTTYVGIYTNILTTNLVSHAQQPGWPPSPIH